MAQYSYISIKKLKLSWGVLIAKCEKQIYIVYVKIVH